MSARSLSPEMLDKMDAYWRAANYLSVGQIYLYDNPLLKRPLALADIKHMLLGHWGTTPGQNFIYVHLNRIIKKYDLDMIYVSGPGHGGPAVVANTYLEGTYSEIYPNISQDEAGLRKLFIQFSFPGGIPSHASPECPGSIHEGGELGYSLSHSFGAVFDNPDLIVACVVGDGEAETGPLAASWHSNKFLSPAHDGAVLPILHLNGYKIANPTVLGRMSDEEIRHLFIGYGHEPLFVEGDDQVGIVERRAIGMHQRVAELAAFVDRSRRFRRGVARNAAGKGELPEQLVQAVGVASDLRVDLAVGAFEIGVGDHAGPAMARAADIDDVEVGGADRAIEMGIDEVQPGRGSPMAEQAGLDVIDPQRLLEQRIVQQIDLADR